LTSLIWCNCTKTRSELWVPTNKLTGASSAGGVVIQAASSESRRRRWRRKWRKTAERAIGRNEHSHCTRAEGRVEEKHLEGRRKTAQIELETGQ
jgi:hypothetical protein